MLFNSMQYVIFYIATSVIYFILPNKIRYIWLLAASYYFYMSWEPKYAFLILFSTIVTYLGAILIENIQKREMLATKRDKYKKVILSMAIIINLCMLVYFKYIDFLIDNINNVLSKIGEGSTSIGVADILLPVGISFFTFQAIGYVIDVYRGKISAEHNFLRYALFVSFFPQLVAGPIERAGNLMCQLKEPHELTERRLQEGLILIIIGFFQKIMVADNITAIIDPVFNGYESYPGITIVLSTMLFGIQIYCDFGGYTNIAIGSAKILGVDLMNNFEAPYLATSVSEFWRRWHISLTSWFRDYLYIPLGGNRKGEVRKYINTFIVFLVSGLWHGASWNYVVWGGLNGILIIIENIKLQFFGSRNANNIDSKTDIFIKRIITFLLVDFAWLFFRMNSLTEGLRIIKHSIFHIGLWKLFNGSIVYDLVGSEQMLIVLILSIILLFVFDSIQYKTKNLIGYILSQKEHYRWALYCFMIFMIIVYGAYGEGYEQTRFIYFQF